ncbi:unnamed protein product [Schistosoma curassoni]|uniref:Reverse transcriptase domain-containing protein n=1 Tax=Schistosoma curassoni TaxID=6186 RepID=A0A183KNR6_9TREM|nr:unnamed protein product [Schistosoma curassoni]
MKDSVDAQQNEFRKERYCTDQIVTPVVTVEQLIEWNSSLYINFINYEKVFDNVDRKILWNLLQHHSLPEKIVTS